MSVNNVTLVGRLGKDVELSYTPSGDPVATFSIATSTSYKDKQTQKWIEKTEWHNCLLWGKRSEYLANYSQKGSMLSVLGSLQTVKWQDKATGENRYKVQIKVKQVDVLTDRKNKDVPMHQNEASELPSPNVDQNQLEEWASSLTSNITTEEIPF